MMSQVCPSCLTQNPDSVSTCVSCGAVFPTPLELPNNTFLQNNAYLLEQVLGRGGFGITYLAWDTRLKRQVAIKEFFPEGSLRQGQKVQNGTTDYLELRQKFVEEAATLARFQHSSIVKVFDVFEANNTAYLVMEALNGRTLTQAVGNGVIEASDVIQLAQELCAALEIVHRTGLLHRDIKPDNIFITTDERVVLIDFGSARAFKSKHTTSHTRLVTLGYAAPEQFASSAKFGAYTDVYGLASTLYYALTGIAPPSATDRFMGTRVPELSRDTPEALRFAIEQGLSLKVHERPQSTRAFADLLDSAKYFKKPVAVTISPQPTIPRISNPTFQSQQIRYQKGNLFLTDDTLEFRWDTSWTSSVHSEIYGKDELSRVYLQHKTNSLWEKLFQTIIALTLVFLLVFLVVLRPQADTFYDGNIYASLATVLVLGGFLAYQKSREKEFVVQLELKNRQTLRLYANVSQQEAIEVYQAVEKLITS